MKKLFQKARISKSEFLILTGIFIIFVSVPLTVLLTHKAEQAIKNPHAQVSSNLPPLPNGWPTTLELGVADSPGGAANMKTVAPYAFRYQYISGGANTGNGWANWNSPAGQFATYYIQDSINNSITPVFTYYMIYQSSPGNTQSESSGIKTNLENTATMTAYFNDLKLFFQKAGAFPNNKVVLHVEPDLWGYIQQRTTGDNAASVLVKVSSTGLPELSGFSDNASGLARAIVKLRDLYSPNTLIAFHFSSWATGNDIVYSDPPDSTVDSLGARVATFFNSLNANYDLLFAEFSDRDAAFKQFQYNDGGAAWWNTNDFRRNRIYNSRISTNTNKRIVMWQIPQGNTKMRAMNNTWDHYQDNRTEWLFDDPTRQNLEDYINSGVIAFLFGRGADGATCACDANNDGVTNPAAINGNDRLSLNSDDDGGYYKERIQAYFQTGKLPLTAATTTKSGDYDSSGTVGIGDLNVLVNTWKSTTDLRADGNKNGVIDIGDLSVLVNYWGS